MDGLKIDPLTIEQKLGLMLVAIQEDKQTLAAIAKALKDCGYLMKRLDERITELENNLIRKAIRKEEQDAQS